MSVTVSINFDGIDEGDLAQLADLLVPHLADRLVPASTAEDGWLDAKGAAEYLGLTIHALYRHTSARTIPFEQDCRGGKVWFQKRELDAWRRGEWTDPSLQRYAA